jgi:hypothetical protein
MAKNLIDIPVTASLKKIVVAQQCVRRPISNYILIYKFMWLETNPHCWEIFIICSSCMGDRISHYGCAIFKYDCFNLTLSYNYCLIFAYMDMFITLQQHFSRKLFGLMALFNTSVVDDSHPTSPTIICRVTIRITYPNRLILEVSHDLTLGTNIPLDLAIFGIKPEECGVWPKLIYYL